MYTVLGANGRAGGETARALIEQGQAVRVVVRRPEQGAKWAALGAEVALADIEDIEAMAHALKDVSGAFLLNPPPVIDDPYDAAEELGTALAAAVRKARLAKAVVLSSIGAQHVAGTGVIATLHRTEALLANAAPAILFLRSGYFVETWRDVAEAANDGVLPTFLLPFQRIPMVSTIDVGRAAAALLREQWSGKRIVELSGPQDCSADDVATAFAEALGHPVALNFIPASQRAAVLAEDGIPGPVDTAVLGMYAGIAENLFVRESTTEKRVGAVTLSAAVRRIVSELHSK